MRVLEHGRAHMLKFMSDCKNVVVYLFTKQTDIEWAIMGCRRGSQGLFWSPSLLEGATTKVAEPWLSRALEKGSVLSRLICSAFYLGFSLLLHNDMTRFADDSPKLWKRLDLLATHEIYEFVSFTFFFYLCFSLCTRYVHHLFVV